MQWLNSCLITSRTRLPPTLSAWLTAPPLNPFTSSIPTKSGLHNGSMHSSIVASQNPIHFFSSGVGSTRRRRRGRGGHHVEGSTSDDSNTDTTQSTSSQQTSASTHFQTVAEELLDKVDSSLSKLKDLNDGLEIERCPPLIATDQTTMENEGDELTESSHGGQLSVKVNSTGDLYWGGGLYLLTIHPDTMGSADEAREIKGGGFVTLQSPLSGSFSYVYNPTTKEWVGKEDGHSLLGMFTRDWIRQCRGVPDF